MMIETRIFIREAAECNCHPTIMFGRLGDGRNFHRDELVYALSIDGRSWHRRRQENAEVFEARIIRDLMEAAHAGCASAVLV
ncbi:MAG: hypothetical protein ACLPKT_13965 [Methylocella sp.]